MPLVEEDAVDDALDGLVERRVVEDDVGRLAAELEAQALGGAGDAALDQLADLGRARERDLVDALVLDQRLPDRRPAGDDVDDAGRQVALGDDLGQRERGQRRRLGGLEHDGVAGRERRRDLPGRHQQREVPRDDLPGHAERARRRAVARVLELVGPAGVVEEVRGRERDVDVARLADRLAVVERLEHRELAGALLDRARDAEEVLRALAPGQVAPDRLVRGPRRRDGGVDVAGPGLGDLGQRLGRRGVDRRHRLARAGAELAVDEDAVGRAQPRGLARLGRGGVLEGGSGRHAQSSVT